MPDYVRLFVSAAPKWAPGKIVATFEAITPKVIFEESPQVKKRLWGGHLWSAGYYGGSDGDKIRAETIKRYIRHRRQTSFDW